MIPGGRAWCRGLLGVLLVVGGVAVELYEELPGVDDATYQDVNDIDTGPRITDKRLSPTSTKNFVLNRFLNALELQQSPYYGSAFSPNNIHVAGKERNPPEGLYANERVFKRFGDSQDSINLAYKAPEQALRPHKKWKIKKGKAIGSQMVCYFKLCAFRSYNI